MHIFNAKEDSPLKHHIIVKYNALVTDKEAMQQKITALFASANQIPGVSGAFLYPNCIPLENWNKSALHLQWKEEYGKYIQSKAIFDCE